MLLIMGWFSYRAFDNIVSPIKILRRREGMIFPMIQAKVVNNESKMIIKSVRKFLIF